MIPTDEELDKVFELYKKYTKLGVYCQQKISMFDFIKQNWNG